MTQGQGLNRARRGLFVLLCAALFTSCVPAPPESFTEGSATLRYQSSSLNINIIELADALGYLDGITLENVGTIQSGMEAIEGIENHEVDVATVAFNGLIAGEIATGAPIKAVAASYGVSGNESSAILVNEDSDIRSIADLDGKTIGMNTRGAQGAATIEYYVTHAGLDEEFFHSITLRPVPSEVIEDRLFQGQVDAVWVGNTALQRALASDRFRILMRDSSVLGPHNSGSVIVHNDLIGDDPETVERLVKGVSQAIEYSRAHSNHEVLQAYLDYLDSTGQGNRKAIYQAWTGTGIPTEGGLLEDDDFLIWAEWIERNFGVPPEELDLAKVYTNEFNPYAK
ncbi:hypothetical protein CDES_06210 [Corynebacterium deserti GIMN1.010]|uniref:SsuA/THI5-like domain-containing protein n=1 Tax=Corynebacterium deserti GIMN1.010 TaxID=931089 RepID=A0A0M4CXK1_9CORY|nr:ABC transporter substrate-binding protein [Corynebacterium deserti]ALC05670.1 hypothetical protein CDES_06210 [Corynebacterium deserti GIMN1.010]